LFGTAEIFGVINGVVTASLFIFLLRIYQKKRQVFYLLWGSGFLLYGLNILLRHLLKDVWLSYPFYVLGFVLLITGTGSLLKKTKLFLTLSSLIPIIPILTLYLSGPSYVGMISALTPFFIIIYELLLIKRRHPFSLDLFVVGWIILLLNNIFMFMEMGPNTYVSQINVEILAIFGKIIIFWGMIHPRFSLLVDDLKGYLIGGSPRIYLEEERRSFVLLNSNSGREKEMEWIEKRVGENSDKGIRTVLITTYDLISPSELDSLFENDIYLLRILSSGGRFTKPFEKRKMVVKDDIFQLELLISDIVDYCNERSINCNIILYTFSWLLHTHGWKEIYSFLVSVMSDLKNSTVSMDCFYYPDTHRVKAEIFTFEKLADQIVTI